MVPDEEHRCKNWMRGMRCTRDATEADGLCNVCRAAKRRGERASQRAREESQRQIAAMNEQYRREQEQTRRAFRLAHHYPELVDLTAGLIEVVEANLDVQGNAYTAEVWDQIKERFAVLKGKVK